MINTIERSYLGEVVILSLHGRIDAINAPALQTEFENIIQQGLGDVLLLNMNDVDYMSAAALRVLKTLHQRTNRVMIVNPSNRVSDVMQITGLDVTYQMYERIVDGVYHTQPIVNAHTHLELGWLKSSLPPITGKDFAVWLNEGIREPFRRIRAGWEKRFTETCEAGVKSMIDAGITTVADISETGLSIPVLMNAGMRGIVYIELHGRDPEQNDVSLTKVRDIIERWRPKLRGDLKIGVSLHAPYSLHRSLWEKALAYTAAEKLPIAIHVAESPAEIQYLKDGTGDLHDIYYKEEPKIEIPGKSPIAFLQDVGALAQKPLLIHGIHVTDEDIALIKQAGSTMVHCPRSNLRLRCGRMPLEKYIAADIPVLLGTDSLASTTSLNVFDEVDVAVALHHEKVPAENILKMVHGKLPEMS